MSRLQIFSLMLLPVTWNSLSVDILLCNRVNLGLFNSCFYAARLLQRL